MSNDFNPYLRWFDIPLEAQPPNHYSLLGLELYESDTAAIEQATERRLIFLQDVANGPYTKESQRLLNEVAAARLCLTDAFKKSNYDWMLQQRLATPVVSVQPSASHDETSQDEASQQTNATGNRAGLDIQIQEKSAGSSRTAAEKKAATKEKPGRASPLKNPVLIRNLLIGAAAVSVLVTLIAIAISISGSRDEDPTNKKSDSSGLAVTQDDIARKKLVIWLDASDSGTLELIQGRIKTWKDKSQRQHDAVQENEENLLQFSADACDGKPAVILGKPAFLSLASTQDLNLGDNYTIAMVAWSDKGVLLCKGLPHKQDSPSAFSIYNGASRFRISKSKNFEVEGDDTTKWKVRIAVADQKSFCWYIDGLGEFSSSNPHSISNSDPLVIGRRLDDRSPEYARGALAELLIYNRAISEAERKQLEAYLTQKWLK